MFLSHEYKLKPTRQQREAFGVALEGQRQLYNAALQERRDAWRLGRHRVTKFAQMRSLTEIRANDAAYGALPATLSRWTLQKVDLAFAAFFQRAKVKKGRAGYPRFRGKASWRSFGFSEWSGIRLIDGRIVIKGLGAIRLHMHRPLPEGAVPRACAITRDGRSWRIAIQIAVPDFIGPHSCAASAIGLDLNVLNRATDSSGAKIDNPQHLAEELAALRTAQRSVARRKKGSSGRRKTIERAHRLHAKIARRRKTAMHQASAKIAREHGVIAVEKLAVANMTRSARGTLDQPGRNVRAKAGLNRALLDVAPATFKQMLVYKAERAGGRVVEVAPHGTSRDCSACGEPVPKTLKQRVHRCPHCGLTMDRDHNAARNILLRAQAVMGLWDANVDQSGGFSVAHRSCVVPEISFDIATAISN